MIMASSEGLYIINPTLHGDNRGCFMKTYYQHKMEKSGSICFFVQNN